MAEAIAKVPEAEIIKLSTRKTNQPLSLVTNENQTPEPYEYGGHDELIKKAMVAPEGKLSLIPNDLNNPDLVKHIHPQWRDQLSKGNRLEIHSWGMTNVFQRNPDGSEVLLPVEKVGQ